MGLYNTRLGVLILYIGIGMPMGVYLGTEYIKSIPDALVESARIDGATYGRIFWRIIVPCPSRAVTVAILTVTGTWNEFMLINILTSSDGLKSLPVGVQKFAGRCRPTTAAICRPVIGLIPMLLFLPGLPQGDHEGSCSGAVKG